MGIGSFPSLFKLLSSGSFSRWTTVSSDVPFSRYAKLIDLFNCDGILANRKKSIFCWASSWNARSAYSFSYSENSESDFVFGLEVSLCHLYWAVVRDSSLMYFRQNNMSTPSRILLLVALMWRKVCNASFLKCAWKWLIFIASVISGCILSIVWKKLPKDLIFSFLPSNITVLVEVGFNVADATSRWWDAVLAIASPNLLIEKWSNMSGRC